MRLNTKVKEVIAGLRNPKPVMPPQADYTQHHCKHCGYDFVGRICPMCGMPGGWTRFTWRKLLYGFLDIWGLGNRPMFRSMGYLMSRPGYMIRDYLDGHYLSYFPPFKMLAVVTVLVTFVIWLLNIDVSAANDNKILESLSDANYAVVGMFNKVRAFFLGNTLYRLLLQIVMLVVAVWVVFRRYGLNMVETFFAMVYISCQMQLVTIGWLLLTRAYVGPRAFPYALPEVLTLVLLVIDFRQLYGLSLPKAVWRTLLMSLLLVVLYVVGAFAISLVILAGMGIEHWLS